MVTTTTTTILTTGEVRFVLSFNRSKERERERERMDGNELPTIITETNTYQKSRRRRTTTTITTSPGEVIFVHSFNRSREI